MKSCRKPLVLKTALLGFLKVIWRNFLRRVVQQALKAVGSMKGKRNNCIRSSASIFSISNNKYPEMIFSDINKKIRALEKLENNSVKEVFYHIREFYDIDFRDLKFAVDDYGNITYLNQDF